MGEFTAKCQFCNQSFRADTAWIGMRSTCPICHRNIIVSSPQPGNAGTVQPGHAVTGGAAALSQTANNSLAEFAEPEEDNFVLSGLKLTIIVFRVLVILGFIVSMIYVLMFAVNVGKHRGTEGFGIFVAGLICSFIFWTVTWFIWELMLRTCRGIYRNLKLLTVQLRKLSVSQSLSNGK